MRLHLLVAAAVLIAAPLPAPAQDAPIQRWPSREAPPAPSPSSGTTRGGDERTAVPRSPAPERAEPTRTAEPRSPVSRRDPAESSNDSRREPRQRWPSRENASGNTGGRDRVAVRRPAGPQPPAGTADGSIVWNVANLPYAYPYVYYPRHLYPYGYGAFGLGYFYYFPYAWHAAPLYSYGRGFYGRSVEQALDSGRLQLKVSPREAQVYVDGYFAGTIDDYDGRFQSLRLEAGTYHIQLVRPGFQTLEFDVRITPGQKITYTGELQREP